MARWKAGTAACAAMVLTVALAGCSNSRGGAAGAGSTYNIGFVDSLSGPVGPYGAGQLKGAQAYVDDVNAHGGINGKKLTLSTLDDGSQSARAVSSTLQLINQQHVLALAGFALSDNCDAALSPAGNAGVSLLCIAAARNLLHPPDPHLFLSQVDVGDEVASEFALAKKLVAQDSLKVAFVTTDAASNVALRDGLNQSASTAHWQVVANEIIPHTTTDASTYVNAVVKAKPDVVLGAFNQSAAIVLMRSLSSAGLNVPAIDYNGGNDVATLKAINSPNFYVVREYSYGYSSFAGSANQQFIAAANANGVDPNQTFVVNGYFQMYIIGAALKQCGQDCSATGLNQALASLSADTNGLTAGPIAITSGTHSALSAQSGYVWDSSTGMPKLVASNLQTGNAYPPAGS